MDRRERLWGWAGASKRKGFTAREMGSVCITKRKEHLRSLREEYRD